MVVPKAILAAFGPPIFPGQQYVCPAKGQDVGHQLGVDRQAVVLSLSDRLAEMQSIQVNDDGGEQVEPSHAVVLALAGTVADFTLATDPKRGLERVMSLSLVEAGAGAALSVRGTSSGRYTGPLQPRSNPLQ